MPAERDDLVTLVSRLGKAALGGFSHPAARVVFPPRDSSLCVRDCRCLASLAPPFVAFGLTSRSSGRVGRPRSASRGGNCAAPLSSRSVRRQSERRRGFTRGLQGTPSSSQTRTQEAGLLAVHREKVLASCLRMYAGRGFRCTWLLFGGFNWNYAVLLRLQVGGLLSLHGWGSLGSSRHS